MSPSSPERTKVTKQQTISLKMQLFCWLWVLDLSPAKAVARYYLAFLFFSIYSQKKAMSCLPGLLDQPLTGSQLLPLLLSSLPFYSPRAAKVEPLKKHQSLPFQIQQFWPSNGINTVLTTFIIPSKLPTLLKPQQSLCCSLKTPGSL